jgi:hypothetical protein
LAILSEDVYCNDDTSTLASSLGWRRLDGQCWAEGFSAGIYQRGSDTILAYRGTDDMDDVLSDMAMVPDASAVTIGQTIAGVLQRFNVEGHGWLPEVVEAICRTDVVRRSIRTYANQVPTEQRRQALAYFNGSSVPINYVTGHSLGGGLAQMIGLERHVPAIGFNSPNIGGLRRGVPMSSTQVLQVNARLDPVSSATRDIGNLAHGRVVEIDLPPLDRGPPRLPQRRSIGWWALVAPVIEAVQRTREAADWLEYWDDLRTYLVASMLHYHGMGNLRRRLRSHAAGARPIDPNFTRFT